VSRVRDHLELGVRYRVDGPPGDVFAAEAVVFAPEEQGRRDDRRKERIVKRQRRIGATEAQQAPDQVAIVLERVGVSTEFEVPIEEPGGQAAGVEALAVPDLAAGSID